jgi:hypothetical protein
LIPSVNETWGRNGDGDNRDLGVSPIAFTTLTLARIPFAGIAEASLQRQSVFRKAAAVPSFACPEV